MSWIKTHRATLDSQVFSHAGIFKIWMWCLLKANFKDRFSSLKVGKGEISVSIKRGSFIFGRFKAEEELGIDGSTIYKHLQKLKEWGNIEIDSNNQYSIITICNYASYQGDDNEAEQPSNNQVTAEEQPSNSSVTHNKNVKKDKKDNKEENVKKGVVEKQEQLSLIKKEDEEIQIIYPFDSSKFMHAWELWELYKKEQHRFVYKKALSKQAALIKLSKLSGGNEEVAIKIIHESIGNGWQGFFELKTNNNGTIRHNPNIAKSTAEQTNDVLELIRQRREGSGNNGSDSHAGKHVEAK